ncbi:hypothetical protein BH09CHL1_BH09CHL1_28690 [soil metagenome]
MWGDANGVDKCSASDTMPIVDNRQSAIWTNDSTLLHKNAIGHCR